eukprot:CAMPEP_0172543426 /NCGR_PEP_ID=MMETSP1067-20121228/13839_1 /TAXON_ID=265564 ORGANISM="Thalassiosira punctigera, Strain Tpunct2005C2" /NCGR_SAMPLE_ID=MMETSP1067 /ASSEMBLY_ACC=CAM_ASM_000444 /LENGTH=157 /DNA_ID=CAMNT_0013329849 /DNA_START=454 /DNA_END=929 /DNA_ORIENTATION=+
MPSSSSSPSSSDLNFSTAACSRLSTSSLSASSPPSSSTSSRIHRSSVVGGLHPNATLIDCNPQTPSSSIEMRPSRSRQKIERIRTGFDQELDTQQHLAGVRFVVNHGPEDAPDGAEWRRVVWSMKSWAFTFASAWMSTPRQSTASPASEGAHDFHSI